VGGEWARNVAYEAWLGCREWIGAKTEESVCVGIVDDKILPEKNPVNSPRGL
jgi:hypothetical protein